jgi:DNA-binding NarL/FixJ family response regulator
VTSTLRLLSAAPAPIRFGIRMALARDVEICAEVDNAQQAIRAAKLQQPDVCLVARDLAGDGLAAVLGICRAAPQAAVLVLADNPDSEDLIGVIRAGAIGYVSAGLSAEVLRRVVTAMSANEAVVPRSMVLELLLEVRGGGVGVGVGNEALSARESQVLGMVRRGNSTSEIAERLNITPVTVRRHISSLVRKLGVSSRAHLLAPGVRSPEVVPFIRPIMDAEALGADPSSLLGPRKANG